MLKMVLFIISNQLLHMQQFRTTEQTLYRNKQRPIMYVDVMCNSCNSTIPTNDLYL